MKKLLAITILMALSILSFNLVFAESEFVNFNGAFVNGTTLYSEPYPQGNYYIYAVDAYPDRTSIDKACVTETVCRKYSYHYETNCTRTNRYGRCTLYMKKRINDGCIRYSEVKRCTSTPIGCLNIETGRYTNQFALSSFKISTDNGITWNNMPYSQYGSPSLFVQNSPMIFKADIPYICSPEYRIDQAIKIKSI